jgi:hypothetical protein
VRMILIEVISKELLSVLKTMCFHGSFVPQWMDGYPGNPP